MSGENSSTPATTEPEALQVVVTLPEPAKSEQAEAESQFHPTSSTSSSQINSFSFWSEEWTKLLINTYEAHSRKFKDDAHKKRAVWSDIHAEMTTAGIDGPYPTVDQTQGKWKTLLAAYRRAHEYNKTVSEDERRECAFQKELEVVLGDCIIVQPKLIAVSPGGAASSPHVHKAEHHRSPAPPAKRQCTERSRKAYTAGEASDLPSMVQLLRESMDRTNDDAWRRHQEEMGKLDALTNVLTRIADKL